MGLHGWLACPRHGLRCDGRQPAPRHVRRLQLRPRGRHLDQAEQLLLPGAWSLCPVDRLGCCGSSVWFDAHALLWLWLWLLLQAESFGNTLQGNIAYNGPRAGINFNDGAATRMQPVGRWVGCASCITNAFHRATPSVQAWAAARSWRTTCSLTSAASLLTTAPSTGGEARARVLEAPARQASPWCTHAFICGARGLPGDVQLGPPGVPVGQPLRPHGHEGEQRGALVGFRVVRIQAAATPTHHARH